MIEQRFQKHSIRQFATNRGRILFCGFYSHCIFVVLSQESVYSVADDFGGSQPSNNSEGMCMAAAYHCPIKQAAKSISRNILSVSIINGRFFKSSVRQTEKQDCRRQDQTFCGRSVEQILSHHFFKISTVRHHCYNHYSQSVSSTAGCGIHTSSTDK
jgi:hypothetical protein